MASRHGSIQTDGSFLKRGPKKSSVDNTSTCLSKIATDPIERLHLSFLKWTMGVKKYTSNAAVWGETGRHPLALVLTKQVFAYLHRVQKMNTDDSPALVRHAVKEQENLNLDWFSKLQARKTGLMNKYSRSFNHPSQIRSGIKVWFEEVWNRTRVLIRKQGFYYKVKESFGPELYLSLKLGYFENKRVAQLRISCHQYNIETMRLGDTARTGKVSSIVYAPLAQKTTTTLSHFWLSFCFSTLLSRMKFTSYKHALSTKTSERN